MKKNNYLISSYDDIEKLVECGELDKNLPYFILIHISEGMYEEGEDLVNSFINDFNNAKIAGSCTQEIIYNGMPYKDKTLAMFMLFDNVKVKVKIFDIEKNTEKLAKNVIDEMLDDDVKVMFNFFQNSFLDDIVYLDVINDSGYNVKVCGGRSAFENMRKIAYVFSNEGVKRNAMVAVTLSGDELYEFTGKIKGMECFGMKHTITKTDAYVVKEVDEQDIRDFVKENMGDELYQECLDKDKINDFLMNVPMILDNHDDASAFCWYDKQYDVFGTSTVLKEGEVFKIGYLNSSKSKEETSKLYKEIEDKPVEQIITYSCILRKSMMDNISEWEYKPLKNCNVCGAYLYGEIVNDNGYNEAISGCASFLCLSEDKDKRVEIDKNDLNIIKDNGFSANNEVLMRVLKMQSQISNEEQNKMLETIVEQAKKASERDFLFENTNRPNINKYILDNKNFEYDKACYIMTEHSEFASYAIGDNKFKRLIEDMIDRIENYIGKNVRNNTFKIYMYNQYSFMIVAKKEFPKKKFMKLIERLYVEFGSVCFKEEDFTFVNRFVIVCGHVDLLEKIQFTLISSDGSLSRFIVYNAKVGIEKKAQEEMHMVSVIHEAIKNDLVIPYFQPLHDNKSGEITKFEALMRLKDLEGKIYTPNLFMDIAKEYRLYLPISKAMIKKVFDLFEYRTEAVSINLSAYDINSEEITKMIISRVKKMKDASNFIFEILESEDFRDFRELMSFITEVRKYGCKIAVDDFGSGYSNMMEIATLQPEFIKIDGQIIRGLLENELNQKITNNITHLASLFDILLVAEYVENEKLQDYIMKKNIRFSQGYHFSPPVTYDQIEKMLPKSSKEDVD